MKISHKDLVAIVTKEVNGLHEGVLDQLRGRLGDIGSKSGNNKQAGDTASLDGDLERASQKVALQVQQSIKTFTDLLARAQSMRLQEQEQRIKNELQALKTYQRTATPPEGQQQPQVNKPSPSPVDLPPLDTPAGVDLPPMPAAKAAPQRAMGGYERTPGTEVPKPVDLGNMRDDEPFDWRVPQKPKPVQTEPPKATITPPVAKPKSAPVNTPVSTPKPKTKTKLDKDNIKKVIKKHGGASTPGALKKAAKELGVSENAIIQAMMP